MRAECAVALAALCIVVYIKLESSIFFINKNDFMTAPKNTRSSHIMLCGAMQPSTARGYT